ncbi:HAD domain-containing protein [Kitasatospora sp. LaBMicrA B282]|uniref:HAD domain-containing protein n=1 Tax=Kitasatospora sp. LaBMicrA B282 TaxID=3420949 RepID=UPI003D0D2568
MTGTAPLPILFLDVDGPLLPFGGSPQQYRCGSPEPGTNPLLARLDPALGPRLAALPGTLVWATTWEDEANEAIAPLLGLPRLPVVYWPEPSAVEEADVRRGRSWKTRPLVAWAAGRPFAWVDDELTDADRSWVAAHHPGPALLHRVAPAVGLTAADFRVLAGWLERHATAG